MTLIRGRSDSPDLEVMSACFALRIQDMDLLGMGPFQEQWTDSISRLGWEDLWYKKNQFTPHLAPLPAVLWRLPLALIIRTAYFLQTHWQYFKCVGWNCMSGVEPAYQWPNVTVPPSAWIGLKNLWAYPMHNPVSDTSWRRQNVECGKRARVRRGQG